jgi:serine/threonine-protein kinase
MLLKEDGCDVAKVCDFGVAKQFGASPTGGEELTTVGVMLGSPAYMAPEQIRGDACDERTDIYAAGVTLFELLTGRLPHEATSLAEMFIRKTSEPPAHPSRFVEDLDPLLEDIVMHALEPIPALRHASARVFGAELAEVLKELRAPASTNVVDVSVWPEARPVDEDKTTPTSD